MNEHPTTPCGDGDVGAFTRMASWAVAGLCDPLRVARRAPTRSDLPLILTWLQVLPRSLHQLFYTRFQ